MQARYHAHFPLCPLPSPAFAGRPAELALAVDFSKTAEPTPALGSAAGAPSPDVGARAGAGAGASSYGTLPGIGAASGAPMTVADKVGRRSPCLITTRSRHIT